MTRRGRQPSPLVLCREQLLLSTEALNSSGLLASAVLADEAVTTELVVPGALLGSPQVAAVLGPDHGAQQQQQQQQW